MWTWNLCGINGPVCLCRRKTERNKLLFISSTCMRQATMFWNFFLLHSLLKTIYLFIYLFFLFPFIFFDLFFFHSDSFLFISLFILVSYVLHLLLFPFIFFCYFSCLSFCLFVTFCLDLIFFYYSFFIPLLHHLPCFLLSCFLSLNLFICNSLLACHLHSVYLLGTLWTAAVKMRILGLVTYFRFT